MRSTRLTITAALLALFALSPWAAAWELVDCSLQTPWTKDVSPTAVLPEYPRPQMVREDWINLNGLWDYSIRPQGESQPQQWDGEILVPFPIESSLSGVKKTVRPDEQVWYRRTFTRPQRAEGGRLLLHFGAVDWKCTVWVNGREVGEHTGGYDPFTFDITAALKEGENELVVAAFDPTDKGTQPRGKQVLEPQSIWYTAVTGIWQTVWLEPVPHNYIRSLKFVPDVDRGLLKLAVETPNGGRIRVTASDKNESVARIEGNAGEPLELKIDRPRLWSPDSPHLYDLKVELLDGEEVDDAVDSYFGMRKIEVRKDAAGINRLWLNNEVLFHYGPLDQGWWPDGLYTPSSDEALKYDVVMTKGLGMNMSRKHVKVELPRWYYWCDQLGVMVWQDMPSGRANDAESQAQFRQELKEMVDDLHNHPSIVMWVPFNEGWGQHDTEATAAWMQAYDPTRPVDEASGWHNHGSGDVSDMHNYPGPGMRPVEAERVSVLGEFGGLGMPVKNHTWQDKKNWGYVSFPTADDLTDAYVALLTSMRPLIAEGLSAAVYTQLSDVEIEVNGLMTYDRKIVKLDQKRIADAAQQLYGPPPDLVTIVPTSEVQPQTWVYTTSEPKADWTLPQFDDTSWNSGVGGFGTKGTPGAAVRTKWDSSDIWLRRTFDVDSIPQGAVFLRVHHDEDVELYLNGKLILERQGYRSAYGLVPFQTSAKEAIKTDGNQLAVHCHQTSGGQFIDVGIVVVSEAVESRGR